MTDTDIIRYQISPKEIYSDGFDYDLQEESPQCYYTNKQPQMQRTYADANKYETLTNGLDSWCNFELSSSEEIYVSFWNGATMLDEYKASYINIISELNQRIVKIRNMSGVASVVRWSFYGD